MGASSAALVGVAGIPLITYERLSPSLRRGRCGEGEETKGDGSRFFRPVASRRLVLSASTKEACKSVVQYDAFKQQIRQGPNFLHPTNPNLNPYHDADSLLRSPVFASNTSYDVDRVLPWVFEVKGRRWSKGRCGRGVVGGDVRGKE